MIYMLMLCFSVQQAGPVPMDFGVLGTQVRSNAAVRAIVQAQYPATLGADQLRTLEATGTILGEWATPAPEIDVPDNFPLYLWARFDKVISKKTRSKLLERYENLQALVEHTGSSGRDKNRDATDAHHFGVWEHYSQEPYVTLDSVNQTPEAIKVLDGLLDIISNEIAPIVSTLLKTHSQRLYDKQQRWVYIYTFILIYFKYSLILVPQAISAHSEIPGHREGIS